MSEWIQQQAAEEARQAQARQDAIEAARLQGTTTKAKAETEQQAKMREAEFAAQQRWLASEEGQKAVERYQEPWVAQQQEYLYSQQRIKDIERYQEAWTQEQQKLAEERQAAEKVVVEEKKAYIDPFTAKTPEEPKPLPRDLSDEGSLYADTRTPEQRQRDLKAGMEAAEAATESFIGQIRTRALEKREEAATAKAKGEFLGTFMGYAGYTVGIVGAGVVGGITFFVRPQQILGLPLTVVTLATDEKGRGEIFTSVARDPGSFLLEGIGGVIGGYVFGKGLGKLVDFIEGPPGQITKLAEVKVEQVPKETYMDDAGNIYQTSQEMKTRITPKVEKTPVPRDVFSIMEKDQPDIGTIYGYTKNKGYKSGYQIQLTSGEAEALLSGKTVEGSFIKGGQLSLDKAQFPDVYASVKGEPVKGGGLQYFKEPSPIGPGVEGEVSTITMGEFKLRVTGALEAEKLVPETPMFTKPTGGVKTPFYPDVYPAKGAGVEVSKMLAKSGLPSKLGDVTKAKPELDVFASLKTVEAAKITPVTSSFGVSTAAPGGFSVVSRFMGVQEEKLIFEPSLPKLMEPGIPKFIQKEPQVPKLFEPTISKEKPILKTPTIDIPIQKELPILKIEEELPKQKEPTIPKMKEFEEEKLVQRPIFKIEEIMKPKPPPPLFPQPTPTPTKRRKPTLLGGVGGGGGISKIGFKGRLEYTPGPTIEKLRRRLGL